MLQRRNDKIVPRLGISFDAKTLVTYNCNVMNPFHEKKDVAKKKRIDTYWHSSSLDQSKWVTQKQVRTWKKTLLLFLSTTAFSNWRGKPSSAKHKLHPNGFCLYLIPRKKSQTKSRLMSSVFVYIICTVFFEQKVLLSTNGEKGVAWGVCLLCRMASSLVMKTSSSRKLQWPFKKQGGRKEEEKKKRKSCNKLSKVWTKCGIEIISEWAFSLIFMHLPFDEVFTHSSGVWMFHKYFVKTQVDQI